MTDEELAAIKARCAAATQESWRGSVRSVPLGGYAATGPFHEETENGADAAYRDAVFIAHARTDVPALVAEVERLRSDVARLNAFRDEVLAQRKCE